MVYFQWGVGGGLAGSWLWALSLGSQYCYITQENRDLQSREQHGTAKQVRPCHVTEVTTTSPGVTSQVWFSSLTLILHHLHAPPGGGDV